MLENDSGPGIDVSLRPSMAATTIPAMYKNLNVGALGHALPFDGACALAWQYNFAGIDLDTAFLLDMARSQSLQAALPWFAATGLKPSSFGLSVAWRDWDSEQKYVESLPRFIDEAKLAAAFGVTRRPTWIMPCSNELPFHEHFALVARGLRSVADMLKAYGIWLALQFVGPRTLRAGRKYDFIHTMDGMRALGAAIASGNIGFFWLHS